jgi:outer membrane protein OmpA-like peptidoglycan-associated protein
VPTNELFDDPNNAKLKNRKPLDEAGAFLEENRFGLVVIASSETSGDSEKDRVLTQAQAKVVRDYIVQHFRVNDSRIKTIGIGKKTQPGDASEIQILIYSQIPPVSTDSDRAPRSR